MVLPVTRSSAARLDKAPLGTSQRTCDRLSTRTYALAAPVTGPASIELPAEAHGFKLMREEFVSEYDSKVAIYRCGPPETLLLPFERAPVGLVHAEDNHSVCRPMPCPALLGVVGFDSGAAWKDFPNGKSKTGELRTGT